jgi:hypothetical protein
MVSFSHHSRRSQKQKKTKNRRHPSNLKITNKPGAYRSYIKRFTEGNLKYKTTRKETNHTTEFSCLVSPITREIRTRYGQKAQSGGTGRATQRARARQKKNKKKKKRGKRRPPSSKFYTNS